MNISAAHSKSLGLCLGLLGAVAPLWLTGCGDGNDSTPARTATATASPTLTATPAATATPIVTAPAECEMLNAAECLLPYPSSHFLAPATTATGYAVRIPQVAVAHVNGPTQVPASMFDGLDGFSPGSQIMMHFPQGVDLAASNASRLLEPQCCGQPAGPPWIDTRTESGRSLEADSPTVLLDADTGERVLHFAENDARATDQARRLFFLRPSRILTPGHRYVVAVRNLIALDGSPVVPELPFRLLRDHVVTQDPIVEARRPHFESDIFPALARAGVSRENLVIAFDFVVGSDASLHRVMLAMRDQAYAWLDTIEADPEQQPFTATVTSEGDCSKPETVIWRTVTGRFNVPLFLTGDLSNTTTPVVNTDADGNVAQNGFHKAPYTVTVPCSVLHPIAGSPTRPVLMGHGLFQNGQLFATTIPLVVAKAAPWTGIAVATDWRGLSSSDLTWVAAKIIGIGDSQLHNFPAFTARLQQGMLNTLVLTRLAKRGILNRAAAFQRDDGSGVFPGPSEDMYYFGISLGGSQGNYLAGLTPDIDRFVLDVPSVNYACELQRADPFVSFYGAINGIGLTDPMQITLGLALFNELWASAEPVSVVHHVTSDPLPGSGAAKQILYSAAWLDKQVSNICTEISARTMNLPVLAGSIQQSLQGMPNVAGPVPSALIFYDLGELNILDPAQQKFIPPLANLFPSDVCDPHPRQASTPAGIHQVLHFLSTGEIVNTCSGLCDGDVADEQPLLGRCTPPAS
ncbi:MAG: hypothetical protein HY270_15830 [Deltaproteobacteria bacterium]|nr:hypothetical protein [Deltaproteobacteria bacterium]